MRCLGCKGFFLRCRRRILVCVHGVFRDEVSFLLRVLSLLSSDSHLAEFWFFYYSFFGHIVYVGILFKLFRLSGITTIVSFK